MMLSILGVYEVSSGIEVQEEAVLAVLEMCGGDGFLEGQEGRSRRSL